MDPSAVAGDLLKISDMDVRAMDVIGFNRVAIHELAGDFNSNGVVDAADYVMWRKNVGTNNALPNNLIGGTIGVAQYNQWRAKFGNTAPGAGSGTAAANAAVHEPTTLLQMICWAAIPATRRRRGGLPVSKTH
jgi:hypothetical protein